MKQALQSPFEPPRADPIPAPEVGKNDEALRRALLPYEVGVQLPAGLLILTGVLGVMVGAIGFFVSGTDVPHLRERFAIAFGFGLAALVPGYALRQLRPWPRIPATLELLAAAGLAVRDLVLQPAFPVRQALDAIAALLTLAGAAALLHPRARTILGPTHARLIARTRHIAFPPKSALWPIRIAAVLLLVLLVWSSVARR